jgi:hypothetical protein
MLGASEPAPGVGEQLAGDRGRSDLIPPPLPMAWKAAANCGERLAVCAASHYTHRSHTEPSVEDMPAWAARSLPWTAEVSLAQDASLRAEPNWPARPALLCQSWEPASPQTFSSPAPAAEQQAARELAAELGVPRLASARRPRPTSAPGTTQGNGSPLISGRRPGTGDGSRAGKRAPRPPAPVPRSGTRARPPRRTTTEASQGPAPRCRLPCRSRA